ncbi:hypothetical protein SEPCBS57363_001119 [Sporothrix epigloea]|uniref:Uncharacterized protein n=1 Tax=Sporothrix epigloea TaxID=1892477 RepID=A0ABP0D8I4_9PEZI
MARDALVTKAQSIWESREDLGSLKRKASPAQDATQPTKRLKDSDREASGLSKPKFSVVSALARIALALGPRRPRKNLPGVITAMRRVTMPAHVHRTTGRPRPTVRWSQPPRNREKAGRREHSQLDAAAPASETCHGNPLVVYTVAVR